MRCRLVVRGGGVVGGGGGCCGRGGEGTVGRAGDRVDAGAVEVDVEPPPVALVPDARLLRLLRVRQPLPAITGQIRA